MPRADALPESIKDLATKNALEITHRRFADGVAELVNVIETALAAATRRRSLDHDPRTRIAEIEKQKQLLDEELERLRTRIAADIEAAEQQLNEEYASGRPSVDRRGLAEKPYGAFLLYSHAADSHVAASLQHGLQTIAKPWHRLRSIRVFWDASDLSATPGLWQALTQALDESKYVVLLASPEAASSAWVSRELQYWLDHRRSEEILIAVTGGEIAWDAQLGDFDWRTTTALPTILKGAFKSEPLFVDLRGLQANEMVLANPRFATSVAPLQLQSPDRVHPTSLARACGSIDEQDG
jgi:TIR domain-containing protein